MPTSSANCTEKFMSFGGGTTTQHCDTSYLLESTQGPV